MNNIETKSTIEKEMSTVEVLEWLSKNYMDDNAYYDAFGKDYNFDNLIFDLGAQEVIKRIQKYENEHKNKPEVVWGYGITDFKNVVRFFFLTPEEAKNKCEELAKENPGCIYTYEKSCTVKE